MSSHEHDDDDIDASRTEDQRDGGTDPTVVAEGAPAAGSASADSVPAAPYTDAVSPPDRPADTPVGTERRIDPGPPDEPAGAAGDAAGHAEHPAEAYGEPSVTEPAGGEEPPLPAGGVVPPTEVGAEAGARETPVAYSEEPAGDENVAPPAEVGADIGTAEPWTEAYGGEVYGGEVYGGGPAGAAEPDGESWHAEPDDRLDAAEDEAGVETLTAAEAAAGAATAPEAGRERPPPSGGRTGRPARRGPVPPARPRGPASRRSARAELRPAAPPPAPPAARPTSRWMVVLLSALTVAVIALAIYAVNLGRRGNEGAAAPTTTAAGSAPPASLPAGAFTDFRDDDTGFSIRYPSSWQKLEAPLGEIRLLVAEGPYAVQVRTRRTEAPTTPQNLADKKAFADGSIAGPTTVVLQQDSVTVNGLIGFRYLYTFNDEESGIQGAHLHYFLFQGHKMHDIIFQALPTEAFAQAEGIFNQMLESFRSDPEPTTTAQPASDTAPPPGG